ncbi:helix-turn-helix transcriptional regulator [Amycolatopsis sp. cg5]|uniref:helix-turn-helix domain-containing protein n=1 Tax=Amycolatopsis sp. cg5 TaxID=3238802 RepID=UPI003525E8A4
MRRLRLRQGLTQRDLAEAIECDESQMSKVELGERALKRLELTAILAMLTIDDAERSELLVLGDKARELPTSPRNANLLPRTLRRLASYEADASEIFCTTTAFIPELLRVPDYVRAAAKTSFTPTRTSLDALVDFTAHRQKVLYQQKRIWFGIGEYALKDRTGGSLCMPEQLRFLLDIIDARSNVRVQVVPIAAMTHPLLTGVVTGLRFGDVVPDVVHQSSFEDGTFSENVTVTRACFRAFATLRRRAMSPETSRQFIARRCADLPEQAGE